jgi:type I restriction enzyme M protein
MTDTSRAGAPSAEFRFPETDFMNARVHADIVGFIWNIADDVLRDVYVRGKYRDVILPMTVIRRLDAVLEPTKPEVLAMKQRLDAAGIANQVAGLRQAAGQAFYNTSNFSLRDLQTRTKPQQLRDDFVAYLDGFSPNVQEILEKFKFRNQIPTLVESHALGFLIEKFLSPEINLGPEPATTPDNRVLPALDNHSMGTIFEELIRRFNEENNEEAGEHFTPRDVVTLMADLIFLPVADAVQSATYLVYDGACGTGGMLTVAEERLAELARAQGKNVATHLFGQEVNAETFAITKADLLLKGGGEEAENFAHGSTLAADGFPTRQFDFMLSNPPYGKSWKTDLERMGGKKDFSDSRFIVSHAGDPEFSLVTRSSDGQLMFLVNMLSKMKHDTPLGSRIAEVHNGSALFTGDAGQGESNIRRWIIENDWLEAIIALPLNMFYNTGIATYVWVLSNRKPQHRRGKVQLIDASGWFRPLRRNLGQKNCQFGDDDIRRITHAFLACEETEHSRLFDNEAFGYWKITVERPLRLRSQFSRRAVESLRFSSGNEGVRREIYGEFGQDLYERFGAIRADTEAFLDGSGDEEDEGEEEGASAKISRVTPKQKKKLLDPKTWEADRRLYQAANQLWEAIGDELFADHNIFRARVDEAARKRKLKLTAGERSKILTAVSWRDEAAPPVIKKTYSAARKRPDPLRGLYAVSQDASELIVEYEPDSELRDTEQVPLQQEGGVEAFFRREVLPFVPDAWIDEGKTKVGYEISFNRIFYKPPALRTLGEIRADIEALERETEGLLDEVLVEVEDSALAVAGGGVAEGGR